MEGAASVFGLVLAVTPLVLLGLLLGLRLRRSRRGHRGLAGVGAAVTTVRAAVAVLRRQLGVDVGTGLGAEVVHVGGAARLLGCWGAQAGGQTDVLVVGRKDVGLVTGAVHPAVDDGLWRRKRTGAPRQVLSHDPVAAVGDVPRR